MNSFLLSKIPISFETLVLESTNVCNASCSICYQSSGFIGSKSFQRKKLPTDALKKTIIEAAEVPLIGPRVHLSGGEAFLDISQCMEVCRAANETGYLEISATTNAFWAKDLKAALKTLKLLRGCGLNRLEISWDAWHKEFISINCINNCIEACYFLDIEVILRTLSTKTDMAFNSINEIRADIIPLINEIVCCPVLPIGRAAQGVSSEEIFYSDSLGCSCHHMLNLAVNCYGEVYPCCSGLDQNSNLKFGNIFKNPISDIVDAMNRSLLLRVLVFQGPGSLIPILKEKNIDIKDNFNTICHLCWSLFSNDLYYKTIKSYFNKMEADRFLAVFEKTTG